MLRIKNEIITEIILSIYIMNESNDTALEIYLIRHFLSIEKYLTKTNHNFENK